jgi:hypothetical protein
MDLPIVEPMTLSRASDAHQNQIESKPALEAEVMASEASEKAQ